MPSASGVPLGERLAAVANKHRKVSMQNSLRTMLNQARASGSIRSGNVAPTYQNYFMKNNTAKAKNTAKKCGIRPAAWVGTQKNPAFEEWKKCSNTGITAGGKRRGASAKRRGSKTRRGKKSRRATRKHR